MILTLKQARLIKGFTQRDIATKLGVHVQTYSKMEKQPEEVTIREAKKICEILELSYDFIFFNTDSTLSRDIERSHSF
ncbi:helix-turn-helix domain-containing protein [Bacillus sp. mrc49]|uniref:helix-turn-helix domain-containing protein n=1 Tax=Bacillus sp. mrc49 TaxID=2054913 RepID=UPI000C27C5CB|nr:helix-turn-helix transcriptional regulator [Bacillus sp. mrc49]PJN88229.1 XRE family transcriptional regulator [Bacillus sp. mrc49]PJN91430.1 XRE family transcriptional regulator [Bacillus sp. mrc49]